MTGSEHLHACSFIQSCLTVCDPMDCSSPGSSVQGLFQARMLDWAAISFSRQTPISKYHFPQKKQPTNGWFWAGTEKCKMRLVYFIMSESKEMIKEWWRHFKRSWITKQHTRSIHRSHLGVYKLAMSKPKNEIKKTIPGLPGGPVVNNPPCNAGDVGSIPGRGTKIPHAAEHLSLSSLQPTCHN